MISMSGAADRPRYAPRDRFGDIEESIPLRRATDLRTCPSFSASTIVTAVGGCTIQPVARWSGGSGPPRDCVRPRAHRPRRAVGSPIPDRSTGAASRLRQPLTDLAPRRHLDRVAGLAAVDDAIGDRTVDAIGDQHRLGEDLAATRRACRSRRGPGRRGRASTADRDASSPESAPSWPVVRLFSSGLCRSRSCHMRVRKAAVRVSTSRNPSIHIGPSAPKRAATATADLILIRWNRAVPRRRRTGQVPLVDPARCPRPTSSRRSTTNRLASRRGTRQLAVVEELPRLRLDRRVQRRRDLSARTRPASGSPAPDRRRRPRSSSTRRRRNRLHNPFVYTLGSSGSDDHVVNMERPSCCDWLWQLMQNAFARVSFDATNLDLERIGLHGEDPTALQDQEAEVSAAATGDEEHVVHVLAGDLEDAPARGIAADAAGTGRAGVERCWRPIARRIRCRNRNAGQAEIQTADEKSVDEQRRPAAWARQSGPAPSRCQLRPGGDSACCGIYVRQGVPGATVCPGSPTWRRAPARRFRWLSRRRRASASIHLIAACVGYRSAVIFPTPYAVPLSRRMPRRSVTLVAATPAAADFESGRASAETTRAERLDDAVRVGEIDAPYLRRRAAGDDGLGRKPQPGGADPHQWCDGEFSVDVDTASQPPPRGTAKLIRGEQTRRDRVSGTERTPTQLRRTMR